MNAPLQQHLRGAFNEHERFLWGVCYRMTGSAADADDLVQDTFVRALEKPPRRQDDPWRPWLVRVAVNLSRDHLRRRRRSPYKGPWLPAPIETDEEPPAHEPLVDGMTTEGRYDLTESVSYAFLMALEVLTAAQRAVLLLRDVFDYSVRETADALGMSEPNVKTTHHRARRAMETYDRERRTRSADARQRDRRVLEQFLTSLAAQDVPAIEALLAEDVVSLSDGGGVYLAALNPVRGRSRVRRLFSGLARKGPIGRAEVRVLNGSPALVIDFDDGAKRVAPRMVLRCEVDARGQITQVHSILAPRKLAGLGID
jgi:RNA polymerase sigma-70 factor (ECF subfamily)